MSLYEKWMQSAYDGQGNVVRKIWDAYLPLEQRVYENILVDKNPIIKGTVTELAERYDMSLEFTVGFLDGISEAVDTEINAKELTEDAQIDAKLDFERLYKKMVEYDARHLFNLPQWENIYTPEEQQRLYREQKSSGTVVREGEKIGRNDPCPCASGKKYKKCCGAA